jgi:uncharacterized membrane protein YcjF (UPF0283 family)
MSGRPGIFLSGPLGKAITPLSPGAHGRGDLTRFVHDPARALRRKQEVVEAHTERAPGAVSNPRPTSVERVRRLTTETKQAFKTSEFWMALAVVVGILVSAAMIKGGDTSGTDEFVARNAWLYVAIVTGAYCIGRGLAKAGSSDPYTDTSDTDASH